MTRATVSDLTCQHCGGEGCLLNPTTFAKVICPDCGGTGETGNDDPLCVCGTARSEHQLLGCPDGFQTKGAWAVARDAIYARVRDEDDRHPLHCGCPECDPDTHNDDAAIAAHDTTEPQHGLRIDPDGTVTELTWTPETALATMQEAVGGLIQMIDLPTYGLMLVCHDEAKLREGWPERINAHATDLYARECGCAIPTWDAIVGPVLVISNRVTDDGDAVGLTSCGLSDVRCWLVTGWLAQQSHGVR